MMERMSRGLAPSAAWSARLWSLPARALDQALAAADLWSERMRQRHQLGELSDYGLKDLGLTRSDVVRESSKWFWQG